jgi:predicted CoA-binding protein
MTNERAKPGDRPRADRVPLLDDQGIFELVRTSRRIAVVGASSNPARPSYGVLRTLVAADYDCVPVNPNETEVAGVPAVATLAEAAAGGRIDIVDVFRRAELTEEIARDAVAVGARALWLQLDVVNWESAWIAAEGGLAVVMDRCTAIELRRMDWAEKRAAWNVRSGAKSTGILAEPEHSAPHPAHLIEGRTLGPRPVGIFELCAAQPMMLQGPIEIDATRSISRRPRRGAF